MLAVIQQCVKNVDTRFLNFRALEAMFMSLRYCSSYLCTVEAVCCSSYFASVALFQKG